MRAIATRLSFLGLVAIISGKNLYKSRSIWSRYKSNVFRISYDFYGNYNDYGHSRDFRFNSVRTIEPTFGSISTATFNNELDNMYLRIQNAYKLSDVN